LLLRRFAKLTHRAPCRLSATRKKRKPSPECATPDDVKAYAQSTTIPSLHTTKPPGISSLALAKDGDLVVTGGCVAV
jgi:pre-mRNA-processing factor 19